MATPDLMHGLHSASETAWPAAAGAPGKQPATRVSKAGMLLDGFICFSAAVIATLVELHMSPVRGVKGFWRGTLIPHQSMSILLALLCGFIFTLILTSRRLHLYTPRQLSGFLHEQRLTAQACFVSGLMLTGTVYVIHAAEIPRSIIALTIGLVFLALSLRRAAIS